MKFSCDRCGKKYATAEAPAPGRVYKLKCKACGHLIVVKTPASGPAVTPSPAPSPEVTAPASSVSLPAAQPPEVDLEIEAPQPPPPPPPEPAFTPVPTRASEPTSEISMMAPLEEPKPPEEPKPADGGYVDLFADSPQAAAPAPAGDDPFAKAAAQGAGSALEDPFADMRDELEGPSEPSAPATPPPAPASEAPPAVLAPPPPRPAEDKKKGGLPVALIGIGFVAMVGIVVAVALTSGKKAEPPPAPPPPPVAKPAPPPPEPAQPPPSPVPVKPEPPPAKVEPVATRKDDRKRDEARREEERRREEARREADRKREEDRRREEERKREEERRRLARLEAQKPKPEPEKPVQLPDAASALSPEAVQKVVSASRRAFESCITDAARKGTDTKFDGRKVALRLNVNPNGFVTYPTLDDVTLNRTELGECLKAAARLMVFPKFQGDVFHVEVPLTLRGG